MFLEEIFPVMLLYWPAGGTIAKYKLCIISLILWQIFVLRGPLMLSNTAELSRLKGLLFIQVMTVDFTFIAIFPSYIQLLIFRSDHQNMKTAYQPPK